MPNRDTFARECKTCMIIYQLQLKKGRYFKKKLNLWICSIKTFSSVLVHLNVHLVIYSLNYLVSDHQCIFKDFFQRFLMMPDLCIQKLLLKGHVWHLIIQKCISENKTKIILWSQKLNDQSPDKIITTIFLFHLRFINEKWFFNSHVIPYPITWLSKRT